ncbi:MAG: iron-containing alcohol dehydrogenase, partial [Lachnospiraceae bacterium]|nr:iron-containing alcohol dehydrogenase [Lachnospiraceae bacterium]
LAFNSASLGLNHGMAHQLGAQFHIPHGRANAMLLPLIIEYNSDIHRDSRSKKEYPPAVKRYSNVAHLLGLSSFNKIMSVRSLIQWVQFMLKDMNIPTHISEISSISVDEYMSKVEVMAEAAIADACTVTNPRKATKEAVMQLYRKLW